MRPALLAALLLLPAPGLAWEKPAGAPCEHRRECASRDCRRGRCEAPRGWAPGAVCRQDRECASRDCRKGRCR